jgi:hypothetical protein
MCLCFLDSLEISKQRRHVERPGGAVGWGDSQIACGCMHWRGNYTRLHNLAVTATIWLLRHKNKHSLKLLQKRWSFLFMWVFIYIYIYIFPPPSFLCTSWCTVSEKSYLNIVQRLLLIYNVDWLRWSKLHSLIYPYPGLTDAHLTCLPRQNADSLPTTT